MVLRRLARRQEPHSIYEHVKKHIRPEGPGLTESGSTLPDEEAFAERFEHGQLRWAPGALEGVFGRYADSDDDEAAVGRLHAALVELADRPSARARRRVRELFREGDVRARIDALNERLNAFLPQHPDRLYTEMRHLFLTSGHRDEVKYAMAIMGGFGQPGDAELFHLIGRHEEFTLYAAVALANIAEDPVAEWLALLRHVSGWGRTELSELILREPRSPEVCDELLRHGLGVGNALTLAVGCRLHEVLARPDLDDELLARARDIVDSLTWSFESPDELTDYPDGGEAVERLLTIMRERARSVDDFITVFEIKRFVETYRRAADAGTGDDDARRKLEQCGLDDSRQARVVSMCDEILARDDWAGKVEAALESDDEIERNRAIEAATKRGLDLRDYLVDRIKSDPGDSYLWFQFMLGADESRAREGVALALSLWDLGEIARGPALDHFGGPRGPLAAVDYLLQELPRFPGLGEEFLLASLRSPVVRHRLFALRALSRWVQLPAQLHAEVANRHASDPSDDVRESAGKVLAGEPIEDPAQDASAVERSENG